MLMNRLIFEECCHSGGPKGLGQKNAMMLFLQPPTLSINECPPSNQQVLELTNDLDESLITERQNAMSVTRE
jgi:hypothetical protein